MVGTIALLLPFVLVGGTILLSLLGPNHALPHPLLQRSISDYRWTSMRDCQVGGLCAIAAFLMCSRGYDWVDEITGYLAGFLALGVAVCPSVNPQDPVHTPLQLELNTVHTVFAAQLFLVLAYFCLILFRKTGPGKPSRGASGTGTWSMRPAAPKGEDSNGGVRRRGARHSIAVPEHDAIQSIRSRKLQFDQALEIDVLVHSDGWTCWLSLIPSRCRSKATFDGEIGNSRA